jgi:hypothetical protein
MIAQPRHKQKGVHLGVYSQSGTAFDVRYTPDTGAKSDLAALPRWATSGGARLFDLAGHDSIHDHQITPQRSFGGLIIGWAIDGPAVSLFVSLFDPH